MMTSPVHKSYLLQGFMGALMVNIVLFCSLPGFINYQRTDSDIESLNLVYISRIKPDTIREKPEKKLPEKKEKPKPELQKIKPIKTHRPIRKKLKMEMPDINFEINQKISGGIQVAAPEPVIKKEVQALADFSAVMGMGEVDTIPALSFKKNPRYPYRAKRMGIEGKVQIRFLVDKNGLVSNIEILEATPSDIFNDSVIKAVSSWKYLPGELLGQKVATLVTTSVVFKMEKN